MNQISVKGNTDYYQRLNIPKDASPEEIRQAYRMLSLRVHPDVNKSPGATELFLDIQEAYKTLANPEKRAEYDKDQSPSSARKASPTFETDILYSAGALLRIDEPQRIYSLVQVAPTKTFQRSQVHLPLHVALVLDLSTSMKGNRLNTLKAATIDLIQDLKADDLISIITFNDRANVLFSAYSPQRKASLENKIRGLSAQGGTEIFQGLETAFEEMKSRLTNHRVHHIILVTDGHTYGDEENCLALAQEASEFDIGISGFGIGSEWNDEFLDQITSLTGGYSVYVREPKDVEQFLKKQIHHLTQAYARNVELDLTPAPRVELRSAFRVSPESNPLPTSPPYLLGSLRHNGALQVLLEFFVGPISPDIDQIGLGSGEYTIKLKNETQFIPVAFRRPVVPAGTPLDPPPTQILNAQYQLTMVRLQENAQEQLQEGNPEAAYQKMQYLATQLLEKDQKDLAETALQESTFIKKHHTFSPRGKKRLKYGTRRLLLPSQILQGEGERG